MQIVTIAGNTGKDAVAKSTRDGTQYVSFPVAVTTGWGDNKATTWWDVTKWGKGTDKLADLLPKGTKVTVIGEVSTREHDGKTYLQCRADHVTLQGSRGDRQDSGNGGPSAKRQKGDEGFIAGYDDLNDDVPFASADFSMERRAR
jgi:single-strand DNA-binding protein